MEMSSPTTRSHNTKRGASTTDSVDTKELHLLLFMRNELSKKNIDSFCVQFLFLSYIYICVYSFCHTLTLSFSLTSHICTHLFRVCISWVFIDIHNLSYICSWHTCMTHRNCSAAISISRRKRQSWCMIWQSCYCVVVGVRANKRNTLSPRRSAAICCTRYSSRCGHVSPIPSMRRECNWRTIGARHIDSIRGPLRGGEEARWWCDGGVDHQRERASGGLQALRCHSAERHCQVTSGAEYTLQRKRLEGATKLCVQATCVDGPDVPTTDCRR